mgnify:CR=1 FL=1
MPGQFMQSSYDRGHKNRAIQRAPDVVDFMPDEATGNIHQFAPDARLPPEIIPASARVMRLSEAKTSE